MADLVIKISGDIKNYTDALNKVSAQTEDLEGSLASLSKISAVAFAGLVAEAGLALNAFKDSQAASNKLTTALQNQGIYSKDLADSYKDQAAALQILTGIDDDAIISAQAFLQSMIGQQEITPELTQSILDLSVAKEMDLESTAQLIGKGINGQTAALKKLGIEIDENLTKEERTAQIIEKVNQAAEGQAAAANKGLGAIKGLQSAFSKFQEEIGSRLAPIMEIIIKRMTEFFLSIAKNKPLLDLIVQLGTTAAIFTGIITVVGTAGIAFLKFKAALAAAQIATSAMTLATRALVGATGIGLIAIIVADLALNWEKRWMQMQAIFAAFTNNIAIIGTGLSGILSGVFNFDISKIKEGLSQVKDAFTKGIDDFTKANEDGNAKIEAQQNASEERQNASKKAAADKKAAIDKERENLEIESREAHSAALEFETQLGSEKLAKIKQEEADILKALAEATSEEEYNALVDKYNRLLDIEAEQFEVTKSQREEFQKEILANNSEFQAMTDEQKQAFLIQNQANLQGQFETERTVKNTYAVQTMNEQIQSNNRFLLDQQKFGTAYAAINQAMHSQVFQGAKQGFGELSALTQSENSKLKAIGKVAAIASIVIKTAESAMNIYAGFSAIPIVGPVLGIAGAAAAILFGAEQVGKVSAAAQGGLMTGGISGLDSIPTLTQNMELVSPAQNFEEVIGSVRAAREAEKFGGGGLGGRTQAAIAVGFDGREASQVLTIRQIEDKALGISRESVS